MKLPRVLVLCSAAPFVVAQASHEAAPQRVERRVEVLCRQAARRPQPEQRAQYLVSRAQDNRWRSAVATILVREDGIDDALLGIAKQGRRSADRSFALGVLLQRGAELEPLLELALQDRDGAVPTAFAEDIRVGHRGAEAVRSLAPHLLAPHPEPARAANVLAAIGEAEAIAPLRAALAAYGCACTRRGLAAAAAQPRAHAAFLTQTAYIRDYNVEIA